MQLSIFSLFLIGRNCIYLKSVGYHKKKGFRVEGLMHSQPENNAFEKGPTQPDSTRFWDEKAQLNPTQLVFPSQKRVQPEKSGRVWPHYSTEVGRPFLTIFQQFQN